MNKTVVKQEQFQNFLAYQTGHFERFVGLVTRALYKRGRNVRIWDNPLPEARNPG
jgi:hypothetical protein